MAEPALDLSEILDLYREDARRMVAEMHEALARWEELARGGQPRESLRRLAHQLRGSGRTYGFREVTRLAKAIEHVVQKLESSRLAPDERVRRSLKEKVGRLGRVFQR
jgi:chemotaxis protein histidine kinase CheA